MGQRDCSVLRRDGRFYSAPELDEPDLGNRTEAGTFLETFSEGAFAFACNDRGQWIPFTDRPGMERMLSAGAHLLPGALWPVGNRGWRRSCAIVALFFASIFKVVPDARINWNNVWAGAILTAILFTAGWFRRLRGDK